MKAAFFTQTGPTDVLPYDDLPEPKPVGTQVLIRVRASAVNPIDTYVRSGAVSKELPSPYIVGADFPGDVVGIGSEVTGLEVGYHVCGCNWQEPPEQGTCAELLCTDQKWVYLLDDNVSFQSAAALALVGITAHLGLFREAGLRGGETVFVNGGSGSVGSAVVQMAKAIGATVITTASSESKAERCRAFGGDVVIEYRRESLKDRQHEPEQSRVRSGHDGRHQPSGRWLLGFLLASITTCFWSTAPIALSLLIDRMDAPMTTFYRFASVSHIPPGTAQLVMQVAPFLVLIGSVLVYREPFSGIQFVGLGLLSIGLLLFFNRRLSEFAGSSSGYLIGTTLIVLAAVSWASCVLSQKQLLTICAAPSLMLVLYLTGAVLMLPLSTLEQIQELSGERCIVLGYCIANMLISCTCFAEALQHWESSRVSMVVCTSPLLTLALSHPASLIWPGRIMPDNLNVLGVSGAIVVVSGSMLCAFGGQRSDNQESSSNQESFNA